MVIPVLLGVTVIIFLHAWRGPGSGGSERALQRPGDGSRRADVGWTIHQRSASLPSSAPERSCRRHFLHQWCEAEIGAFLHAPPGLFSSCNHRGVDRGAPGVLAAVKDKGGRQRERHSSRSSAHRCGVARSGIAHPAVLGHRRVNASGRVSPSYDRRGPVRRYIFHHAGQLKYNIIRRAGCHRPATLARQLQLSWPSSALTSAEALNAFIFAAHKTCKAPSASARAATPLRESRRVIG